MKEACTLLGVHPNTIRRWDKEGKIKVVRPEGGQRRIPEDEIKRLLEKPSVVSPLIPQPTLPKNEHLSFFLSYVFSYHRDDWELVKRAILIRDDYTCSKCGGKELLGVHHKDGTSRNDPGNLVTLCQKCHHEAHKVPSLPPPKRKIPSGVPVQKPEKIKEEIRQASATQKITEIPRYAILDALAPAGLAQRTIFGDLLSAAVVLRTFTPEDLTSRTRCPEAVTRTFCERMSARGYLTSKNGIFELRVRVAR
jgi:excisionase family DNA binding protein